MSPLQKVETYRVFVATWNVGGKSPQNGLNLDDFLQVNDQFDIYVLGFQEIVPLNAGNVLVIEDNGPAAKWLSIISRSLNNGYPSPLINQTASLKTASRIFRTQSVRRWLKSCNCSTTSDQPERKYKDSCFKCQQSECDPDDVMEQVNDIGPESFPLPESNPSSGSYMKKYSLIASKQMVGIFLTIWVRKELVQYIGHLRTSYISRGIMGYLGNKGCISLSMSLHQTSFCFVCSHLASGEKEGDELRRNSDVVEIIKNTQFPRICRRPNSRRMPEKILEHDRIIWLGDLNYRIALSYTETRKFVDENNWDALLNKDQLKIEREAGRVFNGWKEGKIYFAPTYKYYNNSDAYTGEIVKSKSKRRAPAWCDRILWHGDGIRQLSYVRRELRVSDHRPVCATFLVDVVV